MVEFCENCGGMMLPSKQKEEKLLVCNLCNYNKKATEDLTKSYNFNKEIYHPPGEEFKNLEKIEEWKEKEIYNKFNE
jgi:DNA-directed RNA polymerase subunit M/transcription elongation factor TFIIS